jgi:hypothetical protein
MLAGVSGTRFLSRTPRSVPFETQSNEPEEHANAFMFGVERRLEVVFTVEFQDEFSVCDEEDSLPAAQGETTADVRSCSFEHELDSEGLAQLAKLLYDDGLKVRHYGLSS